MIDVADPSKFDSATLELHNLLAHSALNQIPVNYQFFLIF